LAYGVYKWLSERYKLSWLETPLAVLSIVVGLILTAVICVAVWRKARAVASRLKAWWEVPQNREAGCRTGEKS
jgi:uncharacterized membrane protein YciS (DUF1049 family)